MPKPAPPARPVPPCPPADKPPPPPPAAPAQLSIRAKPASSPAFHPHLSSFTIYVALNRLSRQSPPGERERVCTLSHPVTRGGVGEQRAPRPRRRKPKSSKEYPLYRRKTKFPPEQSRENARGRAPLVPRHPRGCMGAARPTLAPSKTKIFKRTSPASAGNELSARTASGERERVCTLSHPVTRGV